MVKLKQYGVLQNILEKYAIKPNCNGQITDGESAASIRFEKVVLPFTIFAIGSIFAIIIMAFEKRCLIKKKSFEDCKYKESKQPDSDAAYRRRQNKLQAFIQKNLWLATSKKINQSRKLPRNRYTM